MRGPRGVIDLSLGEFRILAALIAASGAIVAWRELAPVYGVDVASGHHALEQAISRLRTKLQRRGSRVAVATAYGVGWSLAPER